AGRPATGPRRGAAPPTPPPTGSADTPPAHRAPSRRGAGRGRAGPRFGAEERARLRPRGRPRCGAAGAERDRLAHAAWNEYDACAPSGCLRVRGILLGRSPRILRLQTVFRIFGSAHSCRIRVHRIEMLPALIRKAVEDAGFDLILGEDAEWTRIGVSGVEGHVWVVPVSKGALLALGPGVAASEFQTVTWTDVPLPPGAVRAARFRTLPELYDALRRVRVLLNQTPPLPEKRLEERLREISSTEAEAVVRQRVGQDLFREMLMEYWDGRCAVTGLAVPELLRASH